MRFSIQGVTAALFIVVALCSLGMAGYFATTEPPQAQLSGGWVFLAVLSSALAVRLVRKLIA
ncbi:hypothetical protein SAMN02745129_2065 [Ferrimonas marina]|uniref:Uncharacterized protein n=1 Tax=Ferrimonas marina TaxID=299255 RepID=A0A1M5TB80_9GAMM|nr:hypothetical protein SAMN02745129_2065 [Ferrimonas marina]